MNDQLTPEQGQLVQIRNRFFLVQDIKSPEVDAMMPRFHKVSLECVDDDRLGSKLDLVWELEPNKAIHSDIGFPSPESWDSLSRFEAFTHALLWSSGSLVEGGTSIFSPFMGAIEMESYQFEPVVRALKMPRVNLLIADDVGLGKTIEAGLVVQELLYRQRIRRIMIVCPASLMKQWQDEMRDKFDLEFRIIDRDAIFRLRKEYGIRVNPWNSFPRLITSMDFLKREQNLRTFKASLVREGKDLGLKDWDLLIVDEAHNLAPSGRSNYVRDSDRTELGKAIVNDFEHRLFLTATPHNGYTHSFTALLEMLDSLRFSRGPTIDPEQRDIVMIRRLKEEIVSQGLSTKFARRKVDKIQVDLPNDDSHAERRLFTRFNQYRDSRLERTTDGRQLLPIRFALTLLKKRLLSSPLAFYNSLFVHLNNVTRPSVPVRADSVGDDALFDSLYRKSKEDWDDDAEKNMYEEQALQEGSKFFGQITHDEDQWLSELLDISTQIKDHADAKAKTLSKWIERKLRAKEKWGSDRLLIFTEYKDTLDYLAGILKSMDDGGRIMSLCGGMSFVDRERIKAAFQASPEENPVRILLATDAASEGLNLQNHCRYLIHYEIPWNPNKMEQRNGRIDRHGQHFPEVFCHHFYYPHHEDSEYLQIIVDKMETQRADMGAIGELIEREVEEQMLSGKGNINRHDDRIKKARDETRADLLLRQRVELIQTQVNSSKAALHYNPDTVRLVTEEALRIMLRKPTFQLEPREVGEGEIGYLLRDLPPELQDIRDSLYDSKGHLRTIIFDPAYLKERKHVSLIHLNHPLMKRALGMFRASMWSSGFSSDEGIRRVSYKVVTHAALKKPAVIGFGRVVMVNTQGQKLHEGVVMVGGEFDGPQLMTLANDTIRSLQSMEGTHPPISTTLANQLRAWFPSHKLAMQKQLDHVRGSEEHRLRDLIVSRVKTEVDEVKFLVKQRIEEIGKRLTDAGKEKLQLELDFEAEQQFDEDIRWLERRREQLQTELVERPEQIRQRYVAKHTQVYPVGLLYVLPDSMVN